MSYEIDDFEVYNSGSSKLIDAIAYVQENLNATLFKTLKSDNWINEKDTTANLVTYIMELMSSSDSAPLFRKAHHANEFLTNIWLSKVQSSASKKFILSEKRKDYHRISKESLYSISKMSYDASNIATIDKYLYNEYGIVLIFIKNISGMMTDAVTFKLRTGNPVIGMSLRHKRYDSFWFTLMHELAHIHLHLDEMTEPHLDEFNDENMNIAEIEIEIEANALAKEVLAPRRIWSQCNARKDFKNELLIDFSKKYEIHPAIIAGLIRNEKANYKIFSDIVHKIDVRHELRNNL